MMMTILGSIILLLGCVFSLIAALGMARFPDLYCRMHAATKAGAFGVSLILLALILVAPTPRVIIQGVLIVIFFYLTAPIAAQMIGRAALVRGVETWRTSPPPPFDDPANSIPSPRAPASRPPTAAGETAKAPAEPPERAASRSTASSEREREAEQASPDIQSASPTPAKTKQDEEDGEQDEDLQGREGSPGEASSSSQPAQGGSAVERLRSLYREGRSSQSDL